MASRTFVGLILLVVTGASFLACGGGGAGEVQSGVLQSSLQSFRGLTSYEVRATGVLHQQNTTAQVELTYDFIAPDKLRFMSTSTSAGRTDQAGLIIIGGRSWDFSNGTWVEQSPLAVDIGVFSAERLWNLVPFSKARLRGTETINGVQTSHVRFDEAVQVAFQTLAGALLAGTEPVFDGDLTHVTIDYWTDASAGWPIRLLLAGRGDAREARLEVNLTKVNDPGIQIGPP